MIISFPLDWKSFELVWHHHHPAVSTPKSNINTTYILLFILLLLGISAPTTAVPPRLVSRDEASDDMYYLLEQVDSPTSFRHWWRSRQTIECLWLWKGMTPESIQDGVFIYSKMATEMCTYPRSTIDLILNMVYRVDHHLLMFLPSLPTSWLRRLYCVPSDLPLSIDDQLLSS
jgi:hypothetical protein